MTFDFEGQELNNILDIDKKDSEEMQLSYDYKSNFTTEEDRNIYTYKALDIEEIYQLNCGDGSNLIDNWKKSNGGNGNCKIKPKPYSDKTNRDKLYEAIMKKNKN